MAQPGEMMTGGCGAKDGCLLLVDERQAASGLEMAADSMAGVGPEPLSPPATRSRLMNAESKREMPMEQGFVKKLRVDLTDRPASAMMEDAVGDKKSKAVWRSSDVMTKNDAVLGNEESAGEVSRQVGKQRALAPALSSPSAVETSSYAVVRSSLLRGDLPPREIVASDAFIRHFAHADRASLDPSSTPFVWRPLWLRSLRFCEEVPTRQTARCVGSRMRCNHWSRSWIRILAYRNWRSSWRRGKRCVKEPTVEAREVTAFCA